MSPTGERVRKRDLAFLPACAPVPVIRYRLQISPMKADENLASQPQIPNLAVAK